MLKYKGYLGHVTYDDEAKIFHGEVSLVKDVVTFQGKHVDELEDAFRESVDDYLEWCKELNQSPERPFSGKLHIRLTPELHAKLFTEAKYAGLSLNSYINKTLGKSMGI